MRLNGNWQIQNNALEQTLEKAVQWNYHELINLNSIVSNQSLADYTTISFSVEIQKPTECSSEFMVPFAVTSPKQHYYYNFLAFKLAGDEKKISRVSLIKSERSDSTKPFTEKNNFTITEIASAKCSVPYDKRVKFAITLRNGSALLKVNRKKMLEAPVPADLSGKIGFAARNVRINIDDVRVANGDQILLADDFSSDTLYIPSVKIKRVKE